MTKQRRRINRNLVAPRLDELLQELGHGARRDVLAQVHLITAATPGFEALAEMRGNSLSELRHNQRACTDLELVVLAQILKVNIYYLLGLSDDRQPPPDVCQLPMPGSSEHAAEDTELD